MMKRSSMKPATRLAADFLVGLAIFTLVLASLAADPGTAWSLQPPPNAGPGVTTAAAPTQPLAAMPDILPQAGKGASPDTKLASANKILAVMAPDRRSPFVKALTPSNRQIAIMLLATMFSLISAVILCSTRHLRRVIASPRRGEWRRS